MLMLVLVSLSRKGIVKRGAHAIGKKLKNIKKRQDEEDDREKESIAGSNVPSRLGSYALQSSPAPQDDTSEAGTDLTPGSLLSVGSGLTDGDGVKKQFSFRRRVSSVSE